MPNFNTDFIRSFCLKKSKLEAIISIILYCAGALNRSAFTSPSFPMVKYCNRETILISTIYSIYFSASSYPFTFIISGILLIVVINSTTVWWCRKPKCRLLVTHDDYSMMNKLHKDETSVVTILRNPIDRVFSAYEFSVEVAARFLVHPNLTSATKMSGRLRSKNTISTLDIWPWKYLVPWMREDLFARVCLLKSICQFIILSCELYYLCLPL